MSDKQLQSAWETLNTHVKQLKGSRGKYQMGRTR
jgi:hypothetical protein